MWDFNLLNRNDLRANSIIDFINATDYLIINDGSSTRISTIYGQPNSAIDVSIVHSNLASTFQWSVADCDSGSDHLPIFISSDRPVNNDTRNRWDYKNADWDLFNQSLNLIKIFENESLDMNLFDDNFVEAISNAMLDSIPCRKIRIGINTRISPWWDKELQLLKKSKTKNLKLFTADQSLQNMLNLKKSNSLFKRALKKKKLDSWIKFVQEIDGELEPKVMWD